MNVIDQVGMGLLFAVLSATLVLAVLLTYTVGYKAAERRRTHYDDLHQATTEQLLSQLLNRPCSSENPYVLILPSPYGVLVRSTKGAEDTAAFLRRAAETIEAQEQGASE